MTGNLDGASGDPENHCFGFLLGPVDSAVACGMMVPIQVLQGENPRRIGLALANCIRARFVVIYSGSKSVGGHPRESGFHTKDGRIQVAALLASPAFNSRGF